MRFREGKIVEKFTAKNDKEIVFRFPKMSDSLQLMKYFNKVMKETDFLAHFRKVSLKKEREWLKNVINEMKRNEKIYLIVESNGKIVGSGEVRREKSDAEKHIGVFGIALLQEFTRLGIGTRLAKLLFKMAKNIGIEVIRSSYYSNNNASKRLHEKLGFKVIGRFPKARKRGNKYTDAIMVYKIL